MNNGVGFSDYQELEVLILKLLFLVWKLKIAMILKHLTHLLHKFYGFKMPDLL